MSTSSSAEPLPHFGEMQKQLARLDADAATSEPLPEPSGDEE